MLLTDRASAYDLLVRGHQGVLRERYDEWRFNSAFGRLIQEVHNGDVCVQIGHLVYSVIGGRDFSLDVQFHLRDHRKTPFATLAGRVWFKSGFLSAIVYFPEASSYHGTKVDLDDWWEGYERHLTTAYFVDCCEAS